MLLETCLYKVDQRRGNNPQLWIAGCSIAHGYLTNFDRIYLDERYGQLVANYLSLPVSFLTMVSSSIPWAADQILRADITAGDTIIWGLTSVNRFMTYYNNAVCNVSIGSIKLNPNLKKIQESLEKQIIHEDNFMNAIKSISQVQNFCNKINARLILIAHLNISTVEFSKELEKYLLRLPNYVAITDSIDTAEDGIHPGIESHKLWSNTIITALT